MATLRWMCFLTACIFALFDTHVVCAQLRPISSLFADAQSTDIGSQCQGSVYLGSYRVDDISVGWLVCLNRQTNSGWMYVPPSMRQVEKLRWQDNEVEFSAGVFENAVRPYRYEFKGNLQDGTLRGTLVKTELSTPPVAHTYQVTSELVGNSQFTLRIVSRFSNVEYVPDAGDLVGVELILTSKDGQVSGGIITFYIGYWGETSYIPMTLANVQSLGRQRLRFNLAFSEGAEQPSHQAYLLMVHGKRAVLEPDPLPAGSMTLRIRLRKASKDLPPLAE